MTSTIVANPLLESRRPVESYAIRMVFLLVPVLYLPFAVAGGRAAGLAWITTLAFASMLILFRPLPVIGLWFALPYIAYLAYGIFTLVWSPDVVFGVQTLMQQTVVIVVYLVAWRAFEDDDLLHWIARVSAWWIIGGVAIAAISIIASIPLPSPRGFSISLTAVFAVANLVKRSRPSAWTLGVLGVGSCAALGSRMAAFVFVVFFLSTPNLDMKRWMRLALVAGTVPLLMWVSTTDSFQERFFHEQGGTLTDILMLRGNVDTAGRLDNWAALSAACGEASVTGLGMAASRPLVLAASEGGASHPHNEFLRLYCDTGLVGSVLHWTFFIFVFARAVVAWRAARQRHSGVDHVPVVTMTLLAGFLLFSLTDNVLLYTLHYMAPLAAVLGLSDRTAFARRQQRKSEILARSIAPPSPA